MGQSETLIESEIIFSTLFFAGAAECRCTVRQPPQTIFLIQTGTF
jgi:hypothetical protein